LSGDAAGERVRSSGRTGHGGVESRSPCTSQLLPSQAVHWSPPSRTSPMSPWHRRPPNRRRRSQTHGSTSPTTSWTLT